MTSGNASERLSRTHLRSRGVLSDALLYVSFSFVCFKLLLYPISFFFIVVIIWPHEAHCPLDAGRAFVFERAPLATSHFFVPMLNHQGDRRQVLQQSVAWDHGQHTQRGMKVRPLRASSFPEEMASNSTFNIE